MFRSSIREVLMFTAIIALTLPYILPKWKPEKHPPALFDLSGKDFVKWANPYVASTYDFRLMVHENLGTTTATQNGDTEITVPPGNSKAILSEWEQHIHTKIEGEGWMTLHSWHGDHWFEYEILKNRSVRRLFCAIRPSEKDNPDEKIDDLNRIRLVWLNSGFAEGKTDSRVR